MGNKQPIDTGLPSMIFDEGTVKTTSLPKGPHGDKDSEGLKPPADMEPLTNPIADPSGTDANKTSSKVEPDFETLQLKTFADVQALLLSDDEMVQESDNEEVFMAGEEMDEDIPLTDEEAQSPTPNKEQPEPSHAQESDSDSSSPKLKKYDNILPLTERQLWENHEKATVSYADLKASIEGYYEENVDHKDQTDKLKVLEATEACTANSNNISELQSLAKNFDLSGLKSLVETRKAALNAQNNYLVTCDKSSTSMAWNVVPRLTKIKHTHALMQADLSSLMSDTSKIKSMMTNIFQAFKGENDDMQIKEDKARKEQEPKRLTKAVPISAFRPLIRPNPGLERMRTTSTIKLTDTVLKILNPNEIELIGSSRPQPTEIPTPEAQPITTIISIL
ncbi:hypothetical protein Tco_1333137 [Tanacetum coccineum]